MTTEQVPLAAQIEKVRREVRYAQVDRAERGERLWSAVLATLQQHERALAVIEAARHLRDRFVETEARGLRSRERQFAIDILRPSLAALDDAASAAATPAETE